ncbi:MAG: toprim domain-containing protein [Uliginosibacterium sp.]|nr:toprim domain-containing protein [Uliginosibacterium sp.]
MARIPENEIERLKEEVSVERLIEAAGIELKKSGKDLAGRCPFHADDTASLIVTPAKNLWHCFGCQCGGGPIDWVMKKNGVSFRHAVELLREGVPVVSSLAADPVKRSTVRTLPAPVAFDADDQALLNQTIAYYHERFLATPDAAQYLAARGLVHPELASTFRLGVADRTLGLHLPDKRRVAGAEIRSRLQKVGLLRESGHEHFNGSLVVPILDEAGNVVEVYGRKLLDNLRAGTPKHLYLPADKRSGGRGIFNLAAVREHREIILCEAILDALTFWCAGYRNVTTAYGIEGFTDEMLKAFKQHKTERVLIAFDRDEPGERAAQKLAECLIAAGIECWRIQFPQGMDANSYALKVQSADRSLGLLIRKAVWLGKGQPPEATPEVAPALPQPPSPPPASGIPGQALAAEILPAEPILARLSEEPAAPASPVAAPAPTQPEAQLDGDTLRLTCGAHVWQVRGLPQKSPGAVLKLNVRVQKTDGGSLALHVDSIDLYNARARAVFATQAAAELRENEEVLRRELGRVLLACEEAIAQREQEANAPKEAALPTMTDAERDAALAWLRAPDLLAQILADFDACGLTGETTSKLVGYLAAVSRKLDRPLGVVVQSSSAAGKTTLMDAVLAFLPEEDKVKYSAMSGQSLFYIGQTNLRHKVLAIAEEEGASRASYALKLLQSEGELTMASTGKDAATGNLVTQTYHVEGPVALLLTTTARDLDEELMNRCLVLAVDEGREQTRAIHQRQRERRTLDGLLAKHQRAGCIAVQQNAQHLLRPLAVLNPFAQYLSFPDQTTRLRRDHEKYLTLIDTIAFLHQYQRPIKTASRGTQQLPRADLRFSRRVLREAIHWGDTQLRVHLERLVELEYVLAHREGPGGKYVYELVYTVGSDERAKVAGLIEVAELQARLTEPSAPTVANSRGQDINSRGGSGPLAGRSRSEEMPAEPSAARLSGQAFEEVASAQYTALHAGVASYPQAVA